MFHRVAVSAPNKSICQVFTINRNLMCTDRTNPITIIPKTSRAFDYCSFVNVLSAALVASYADALWARHAILDCVTSPKSVCVGGYCISSKDLFLSAKSLNLRFLQYMERLNFLQVPDLGFLTLDVHYIQRQCLCHLHCHCFRRPFLYH